ncbi:MAG: hypothetical protein RJB38_1227 [Pseudomonadota bacterium]|jgi:GNAT superfamily N-acetyltransferase
MDTPVIHQGQLLSCAVASGEVEWLLNQSFPVASGASFYDDFPAWQSADAEWRALRGAGGELLTAAGCLIGDWNLSPTLPPLRVARIGGVVTSSAHRGKGHAGRLMQEWIELLGARGVRLLVLWGFDSPLYQRLGFQPLGRQVRVPIAKCRANLAAAASSAGFSTLEGFSPEIFSFMQERRRQGQGVLLSDAEFTVMARHQNTRWLRVLDRNQSVVGYGAFGRGVDLGHQLHEWGGRPEALSLILDWATGISSEAEIMGSYAELSSVLGRLPEEAVIEPVCLARVLDDKLFSLLERFEDSLWFWGLDGV